MDNNPELTPSAELKSFFVKFSVIRLGIMVFLLMLAVSEVLNLSDRGMRLEVDRHAQYLLFFVSGFALSAVYLLASRRFIASMALFRFQLAGDSRGAEFLRGGERLAEPVHKGQRPVGGRRAGDAYLRP